MAEIKSTMDMVLERAAKMAAEAPDTVDDGANIKKGMRLAASFMNGEGDTLKKVLSSQPKAEQEEIRCGMVKILLRNIVLPRDEELHKASEKALQALLTLGGSGQIKMLAQELAQILGQYNQHREQAVAQLDDAIRAQLQQQAMAQGIELGDDIHPNQHPHYQSELANLTVELNGQYNDAMDERKEAIAGYFS